MGKRLLRISNSAISRSCYLHISIDTFMSFILSEAVLVVSTLLLFLSDNLGQFRWFLISLTFLVSSFGFLCYFFSELKDVTRAHPFSVEVFGRERDKAVYGRLLILGGAMVGIAVICLTYTAGYIAILVGLFAGLISWMLFQYSPGAVNMNR